VHSLTLDFESSVPTPDDDEHPVVVRAEVYCERGEPAYHHRRAELSCPGRGDVVEIGAVMIDGLPFPVRALPPGVAAEIEREALRELGKPMDYEEGES